MYFGCLLIITLFLVENDAAHKTHFDDVSGESSVHTAAQLAKLIHLVNKIGTNDEVVDDVDDFSELLQEQGTTNNENLKTAMALLQNNYDAHKEHEEPALSILVIGNPEVLEEYKKNYESRDHFISNTAVLDEYKRKQKLRQTTETGDVSINFKDFMLDLRRNAVFRLDTGSSKEKSIDDRHRETKRKPKSDKKDLNTEYDNVKGDSDYGQKRERKRTHDDFNDDRNSRDNEKRKNKREYDFDDNRDDTKHKDDQNGIRKKSRDENDKDNSWDVVTKQYNWNGDHKRKKDDFPKDTQEKKFNSEYNDRKHKKKDDFPKHKEMDVQQIKHDRFDEGKIKNKKQDFNIDEIVQQKRKKVNRDDDWNKVKKQDWPKAKKPEKSDNWPKNKRVDKPKTKDWDSLEKPKRIKTKDFASKEIKKLKNNWDAGPTIKTTKWKKTHNDDDWDSYYSNPKKKQKSYDGGGFFGRTPIPYVGKKGIYVENN